MWGLIEVCGVENALSSETYAGIPDPHYSPYLINYHEETNTFSYNDPWEIQDDHTVNVYSSENGHCLNVESQNPTKETPTRDVDTKCGESNEKDDKCESVEKESELILEVSFPLSPFNQQKRETSCLRPLLEGGRSCGCGKL